MSFAELREKHPRLVYDSYELAEKNNDLQVRFQLILEPDIVFHPEVIIPKGRNLEAKEMDNFVFHLGLIESISYWKAACPRELLIKAGNLSDEQITWWHDLFIHGLGELFYKNNIDFTSSNFLTISSASRDKTTPISSVPLAKGDLILVGGGKDSTLTLEMLKDYPERKSAFMLNPTKAAFDTAQKAGYTHPIIVKRTIDPMLLELNRQGYINGHTPFSAYLAFLSVFVGLLHDYKNIIVSNERSAGEENIIFHGLAVNHQYSKSIRFEKLFREYCQKYLSNNIQCFSFLRPLYDLQVSLLFAEHPEQHLLFRSCNVNQKKDSWCGACAKCAFVYLTLSPFLPYEKLINIFGGGLLYKSTDRTFHTRAGRIRST